MLYDELKNAAKKNLSADEIYYFIKEQPIIDTIDDNDKNALMMANIIPDEGSPMSAEDLKKAERVIYWKIADEKNAVRIAGFAWMQKKQMIFFEGDILSP